LTLEGFCFLPYSRISPRRAVLAALYDFHSKEGSYTNAAVAPRPGENPVNAPLELEELLRKVQEFHNSHDPMSPDTGREFEAMMRLVYQRRAEIAKLQTATRNNDLDQRPSR
jgi:hypothetical protein